MEWGGVTNEIRELFTAAFAVAMRTDDAQYSKNFPTKEKTIVLSLQ